MDRYQEKLEETVRFLFEANNLLFTQLINVSMSNELSEINEVFEDGDIYQFKLSHFEDSNDVNVNLLVDLIKKVEQTANSIINLNGIKVVEE